MVFDRTDHEPEEWDPEEEYADPDSDSLTIPRVGTEDAGSDLRSDLRAEFGEDARPGSAIAETDVPPDLLKTFWALVFVINAAVLAISLGVLFLLFEGATTRSAWLLAGGGVLVGFAGWRYRRYRATTDRPAADASGANAEPDTDTDASAGTATDEPVADTDTVADEAGADGETVTDPEPTANETTSGDVGE